MGTLLGTLDTKVDQTGKASTCIKLSVLGWWGEEQIVTVCMDDTVPGHSECCSGEELERGGVLRRGR